MRALLSLLVAVPALAAPKFPAFTVAIDAGHGGSKPGAVGEEGVLEKDIALAVAQKLGARVARDYGGKVLLVRDADSDVPLEERMARANDAGADLFVSIHLNSMPTEHSRRVTHGIETYFLSAEATHASARAVADRENADAPEAVARHNGHVAAILDDLARTEAHHDSSLLAGLVHERLVELTGGQDRGVLQAPFHVLRGARMAAVLCEIGFLSHPTEGKTLQRPEHQEKIARAMSRGIGDFVRKISRRAEK